LCFDNHANCRGVGGTPYLDFILGGNGSEKKNKRAGHARSNRSEWHPALVGEGNVTACLPRGWRGSGAARQLFTLIVAGLARRKLSGVSGRSRTSRFAVTSATVVPAAKPTGPPMTAPNPPPAKVPIKTPPPAPPPIHSRLCFLWLWPTSREARVWTG